MAQGEPQPDQLHGEDEQSDGGEEEGGGSGSEDFSSSDDEGVEGYKKGAPFFGPK